MPLLTKLFLAPFLASNPVSNEDAEIREVGECNDYKLGF
jgi:hypothetical protein